MGTGPEHVVVEPVENPVKQYESQRVVGIRIDSSLEEYLTALGGGDISAGVMIAAKFHKDGQVHDGSGASVLTQPPVAEGMARVNWTQLGQPHDDLVVTYRGKPFTGIAFEIASNGQILSEAEHTSGKRVGLSRHWSAEGVLIEEMSFRADVGHGRRRTWYRTGARKSDGQYELGICVAERQWDQDGTLTRDFVLNESDHSAGED